MSACRSLQHIFEIENPSLPENSTLFESLSCNQITPLKSIHHSSSFTEIFGELHFKDTPQPSSLISDTNFIHNNELISQIPSSAFVSASSTPTTTSHKSSDSFSSLSSESLHLCTEGLGFESSDDVEDLKNGVNTSSVCWQSDQDGNKKNLALEDFSEGECRRRSRMNGVGYPPPISCIGRSGKPWVSFMSYRNNGRFVLKQIRVPTQEILHAHREDGRLKLHFVPPHDDDDDDDEEFLQQDDDNNHQEEEEEYGDVESTGEGEENYECNKSCK